MHNLNLSMQSCLWTLFQLKSSKKRNATIAFTLLSLITIFAFFVIDLVLQSIDYIQYFEVNSNGIKIDFIQSSLLIQRWRLCLSSYFALFICYSYCQQ